jgi:hypothetical protein
MRRKKMATHYKGERIDELLGEIATLQEKLNQASTHEMDEIVVQKFASAYAMIAVAKAKLTALQGEL